MILYLDTSSLVKLYVWEKETPATKHLVEATEVIATSRLAYVEARAAFARKHRERASVSRTIEIFFRISIMIGRSYFVVDISEALVKMAGQLAEKHALRGYDAIHLASAVTLRREGDQPVAFSCFDGRLSLAARREGLKIIS